MRLSRCLLLSVLLAFPASASIVGSVTGPNDLISGGGVWVFGFWWSQYQDIQVELAGHWGGTTTILVDGSLFAQSHFYGGSGWTTVMSGLDLSVGGLGDFGGSVMVYLTPDRPFLEPTQGVYTSLEGDQIYTGGLESLLYPGQLEYGHLRLLDDQPAPAPEPNYGVPVLLLVVLVGGLKTMRRSAKSTLPNKVIVRLLLSVLLTCPAYAGIVGSITGPNDLISAGAWYFGNWLPSFRDIQVELAGHWGGTTTILVDGDLFAQSHFYGGSGWTTVMSGINLTDAGFGDFGGTVTVYLTPDSPLLEPTQGVYTSLEGDQIYTGGFQGLMYGRYEYGHIRILDDPPAPSPEPNDGVLALLLLVLIGGLNGMRRSAKSKLAT